MIFVPIIVVKYCTCILRMLIERMTRMMLNGLVRDDQAVTWKSRIKWIQKKKKKRRAVSVSWRYFIFVSATVTRVFAFKHTTSRVQVIAAAPPHHRCIILGVGASIIRFETLTIRYTRGAMAPHHPSPISQIDRDPGSLAQLNCAARCPYPGYHLCRVWCPERRTIELDHHTLGSSEPQTVSPTIETSTSISEIGRAHV